VRLLHELGHALAGTDVGRPARRLVCTVLASFCDFQTETEKQRGQIPDPLPAVVALARAPVNGSLGILMLRAFLVVGDQWDGLTRELVCFLGWVNVAALCNLLPCPVMTAPTYGDGSGSHAHVNWRTFPGYW
jgi:hypothetical protein